MKKFLALLLAAGAIGSASAETRVGVSIGIHQPGVYGRIEIGDLPRPEVVYAQPVIIAPAPYVVERRPIYLYVPPLHQRDWRRYCGRYSACGQPVYFVQDRWVRDRYEERHPGWDRGRGHGPRAIDRRDDRRDDRGDRGGDRGRGHGNDRGHGRGD